MTTIIAIPQASHELLNKHLFGTLSTVRKKDGLLSSNPVSYTFNGDTIRISTLKSRMKYKNIVADPRICFCVQSLENPMDYVEIRGEASITDDPDASLVREQFLTNMGHEPPADMDPPGAERVIITLLPQQVSAPTLYGGRFDTK